MYYVNIHSREEMYISLMFSTGTVHLCHGRLHLSVILYPSNSCCSYTSLPTYLPTVTHTQQVSYETVHWSGGSLLIYNMTYTCAQFTCMTTHDTSTFQLTYPITVSCDNGITGRQAGRQSYRPLGGKRNQRPAREGQIKPKLSQIQRYINLTYQSTLNAYITHYKYIFTIYNNITN